MFAFKSTVTISKQAVGSKIYKRFFSNKVRVRFAPSPTGFLHLGGLRTALYNYLFAKSHNGLNILRIEDTDLSRKIPSAIDSLLEDLTWCGITYDEEPYIQSERKEIYQKYVNQLIDQGDAYYCFCTSIRLDLIRREALKAGQIPKYDNCCRVLTKDEVDKNFQNGVPACVRFKLTNYTSSFEDLIHGCKSHDVAAQEGDPVILKADGFPTYHFANVVDDHLMNITHVLRGMEWLASTTKHILLYRAFKWDPPQFGHIPLLLNEDGTKLSKRQGDTQVRSLRESGYLPSSIINFILQYGGGFDFKTDKRIKIYTMDELIKKFDLKKLRNNSCMIDLKLLPDFNRTEILRLLETEEEKKDLIKRTQELIENKLKNSELNYNLNLDEKRVEYILNVMKNRISTLEILLTKEFNYLWGWDDKWSEINETQKEVVRNLLEQIRNLEWEENDLSDFLKKFAKQSKGLKYSEIMQTIRVVLTGNKVGHGVAEIMKSLTKEDVLFRLSKAVESKRAEESG